ncbi:MAG TPA: cyclic pyranopterin monophosphate synthase MoaC [Spirochaetota bacterium]|nr:cyclic pyranopterin monophosphate synthase MoaC [Spirochaetota bacterium]
MDDFSHYNSDGKSVMVDISSKDITQRSAKAEASVFMKSDTITAIEQKLLPKGEVFEVARIAGIMAAKNTSGLIPMCHPLLLNYINVDLEIDKKNLLVHITSEIRLSGKTGAEMEALVAASVAALTVYDMCKAVDKDMVIGDCRLIEKKGGKSDYISSK